MFSISVSIVSTEKPSVINEDNFMNYSHYIEYVDTKLEVLDFP